MIFNRTIPGRGVHLILSRPEALSLAAVIANGQALDRLGQELRPELLRQMGRELAGREDWYLSLPTAWENRSADLGQMGIVKLMAQAQARPEIRQAAVAILTEAAGRIGRLIDRSGIATARPKPTRERGL
jgi:hypothetical protein